MADELSARYVHVLDGTYDCVDRIVLNAYHSLCYSAGGFRLWWRSLMGGSEEQLDNTHLMRLAGRFTRRVRAFATAHHIPVIDCRHGERKHDIAEDYFAEHSVGRGLFMILVARAVAPVWDVQRSRISLRRQMEPAGSHLRAAVRTAAPTLCIGLAWCVFGRVAVNVAVKPLNTRTDLERPFGN